MIAYSSPVALVARIGRQSFASRPQRSIQMTRNVALVVSVAALALVCSSPAVRAQAGKSEKKVQQVKLTVDAKGNYQVTPSTVTRDVPVRMEVDLQSVKGCAREVVIDAVNVKKTVKDGDTVIEFTPTKTGPVQVVCGMNMVKGSFKVADPAAAR
jgi:plastocyanin domain-containing protein